MDYLNNEERKQITELRLHYRTCFDSPSGRIVFANMLLRCYFFNDDLSHENPEMIGRHNFIMETLEILGTADNPQNTAVAIVDSILKLPLLENLDNQND